MNARNRWSLAVLTAVLIMPASASQAGEAFGGVCTPPNDIPNTLENIFEQLGELVADTKKDCRRICDGFSKACKQSVKNNARCIEGLTKPAFQAANQLCDDGDCKKGVKEDAKELRNDLKDETKNAETLCKDSYKACDDACDDFVEEEEEA